MKAAASVLAFCALALPGCGQQPGSESRSERPSDAWHAQTNGPATGERYDLSRDEGRGHTLGKHVGRADDELRERLEREPNISAASTWTDRATAEDTVAAALRAERGRIERLEAAR